MAFPDESLPLEFEAYLGDALGWVDLSSRLLREVKIRRGAGDGAAAVSAGSATVILDDDDGAVTPLNALSTYYPHVRRGVPARLAVRRAVDDFGRTVAAEWGTADSGQTWWSSAGSSVAPGEGRHSHSTDNLLVRTVLVNDLLDVEQVSDITVPAAITGADAVAGHMARYDSVTGDYYWLYLQPLAGSSGVGLVLAKQFDLAYSEMATLLVPGVTYTAGQPLRLRSLVYGRYLAVKVWDPSGPEPRDWMLTATDTDITSPGEYGCQSWLLPGNSNTKPFVFSWSNYAARVGRLTGEIASYRASTIPRTDGTLVNATTIQVAGVLRRLGQGSPAAYSALRWDIASPEHTGLIDYWPLEDGSDAGSAAPAVLGGSPMSASGTVRFAASTADFAAGLLALPDLSQGGSLSGPVQQTGTASPVQWAVQWAGQQAGSDVSTAAYVPLSWTTDDGATWEILLTGAPNNNTALRRNGVTIVEDGTAFVSLFEWRVTAIQSGGNILVQLIINGNTQGDVTPGGAGPWTATVAGTLGRVTSVTANPALGVTTPDVHAVGHIQIWDTTAPPSFRAQSTIDSYGGLVGNAWRAHNGETASDRITRVAEQGEIPVIAVPDPALTPTRTGNQGAADAMSLLAETVAADLGLLAEARDVPALLPHLRETLYNRPTRLTVDMSTYRTTAGTSGQVLAPVYDDQGLRNDITVARTDGSSARVVDQDSVADAGQYDDQVELNLATDDDLPNVAHWLVHAGTVDETRHPALTVDLAANPDLIDGWLAVNIGSRVQRTSVPAPYAGTIDQIVDGYTETLGPRRWLVSAVCSPAAPWDVAEVDGDQVVPADGSTLDADLAEAGMSLSLASTAENGVWTTDPADFPLDIRVGGVGGAGGERITLSGITGGTSPQNATVSARGVNGVQREWAAGTSVDVWDAATAAH